MNKKKVLVVDDEQDLTFLISEFLEWEDGYDVVIANCGKDAVERFKEFRPDIVFLDYVMPDMKGDEVLEQMNTYSERGEVSIVLMSGLGEMVYFKREDALEWLVDMKTKETEKGLFEVVRWKRSPELICREFDVKAFIPKPFSKADFLEVLRYVAGEE